MKTRDPNKLFPHDYLLKPLVFLIPQAVKPNHITVFRMIMTPVVLWLLLIENYQIGVPLFIFIALTDALDGSLARLRKQITAWGTFYDPVADKLLIGSVILLIVIKYVNPILAVALIAVELMIIVGGWYKRHNGAVQSANIWGKIKMFLEVCGVMFLLISLWFGADIFVDISNGTLVLAVIFAIVSLLTYSL
ncbi:MAG: CDP-alcohol phosphatidyltransferase family protein [Patescibacteria group bacterium]